MIRTMLSRTRSFFRKDDGNTTVEFILVVPIYLSILMMSIELGLVTLRTTMLERGLDMAVRDIRLGTGTFSNDSAVLHNDIKQAICDNALIILDCQKNLKLEMSPADIRVFSSLDTSPDCTDKAVTGEPVYNITPGQQNELMLLRACLKYNPLFPEEFLGSNLAKDTSGQVSIISTTAFVQEPI